MTYFKTRGRRRIELELIDPRRIEAAIDHPRWWREQVVAVAEAAPWVDLGTECVGSGPNPRDLGPFAIQVRDADTTEVVERHGIIGLAVGGQTEVRLTKPTAIVDIGIAHFGEPPTVVAYEGDKAVAESTVDARQRQIENVRLVGTRIERITIASPDGEAVLSYVRSQPKVRRRASRPKKRG